MAVPRLSGRPRAGAARLTRYRSVAGAAALPGTDPITLGSIIYDFWWGSGVTKVGGGTPSNGDTVGAWEERYLNESAATSGSPYQTYSSTLGVRNGIGVNMALSTPVSLVPPFTVYVLCTYGGTNLYPIGGGGSGDGSQLAVVAGQSNLQDFANTVLVSGTVTGTGSKLFRWRVNAAGTAFFKDGTAAEENIGSFGASNYVAWANIFWTGLAFEAADNYTRRITAFSADIVTGGQSTAVETYINAAG